MRARASARSSLVPNLLLLLAIVVLLFPFVWMIMMSLKSQVQNTAAVPVWVFTPTWENYRNVIERNNFLQYTRNSMIVALAATVIGMVLGLPAAYSIARFKQRGLSLWILISRIIPYITFLLPLFLMFTKLRLVGSFTALIVSHLIITLPLIVWITIAFFEDIPTDLEEAALVDGSSRAGAFVRIILPLVTPGVVTAGILAMIFSWNQFLFSLILGGPDTKTVPVAVFNFLSYGSQDYGAIAAAAVLITLPIILLSLTVQKYIVKGLTAEGVKG
ncbi:sugar ABC transporter permease [Deinococcus radiopugnans]|uniref:Sugar ABC transporter permease n=1 Tax=Deinococcus radiopugnans TaxID=57497 RepID=A0A0A7KIX8_9DEIO|nr:carbohydrate ABC transporter permease [Deinococcus radiopugnans]AIZ45184.1 sugar ABC transporter permease [Deinococcus radiopugnans]